MKEEILWDVNYFGAGKDEVDSPAVRRMKKEAGSK